MTDLMLGIICALSFMNIFIIIYYKRRIGRFSSELSNTLDDMIVDKEVDFSICQDTLSDKLNLKLKRLYEIITDKKAASEKEREELQSLISDISHQVKTPVANLKMYNQILSERKVTEEERKEFLSLSGAQIIKLDFLMQSMIKMSRLESGIIQLYMENISIQEILAEVLSGCMMAAENKNIAVEINCDEGIAVICDKKWTSEAVFNIFDNAVKYTPENGRITVNVKEKEFYTIISIKDTGMGISESEQASIFGRFYRSRAVHDIQGVGIGLFLAREIISKQYGYIQVKSESGNGSEFLIFLKR